jgi:hypothetical protein
MEAGALALRAVELDGHVPDRAHGPADRSLGPARRPRRPTFEYAVVAFPADERYWRPGSRRIRIAQPDTDGQYALCGLPAGDYFVAAADIGADEATDPATLAGLRQNAPRVAIGDGEKRALELKVRQLMISGSRSTGR